MQNTVSARFRCFAHKPKSATFYCGGGDRSNIAALGYNTCNIKKLQTYAYCPISILFHRHILQNDRAGRVTMSYPGHGLWLWLELPGSHRCYIYRSASK